LKQELGAKPPQKHEVDFEKALWDMQDSATVVAKNKFLARPGVLYLAAGRVHTTSLADAILYGGYGVARFALAQTLVGRHIFRVDSKY
jgi:hypothetical protein